MNVRHAEANDGDAVGAVVRRALKGSYALSPQVIDEVVAEYDGDALADRLGERTVTLVAETGEEVVGFARGRLAEDGVGEVVWLLVAPMGRGEGAGTALYERLRSEVADCGASYHRALVLADNQEGEEFLERFGLEARVETEVQRAGVSFDAYVYADDEAPIEETMASHVDADAADGAVEVPDSTTADGHEVSVDGEDPTPGNEAPFFPTFHDADFEEHYGYYCSNCGSTATAMGGLERLECGTCGNVHRADEWDAAYL